MPSGTVMFILFKSSKANNVKLIIVCIMCNALLPAIRLIPKWCLLVVLSERRTIFLGFFFLLTPFALYLQVWGPKAGPYEFKPAPQSTYDDMFSPLNFSAPLSLEKKIDASYEIEDR